MPVGLEIYNAAGVRTFSTNDRVGRVLGSVSTGTIDGSISHQELTNGQAFCNVIPLGSIPGPGDSPLAIAEVTIVGGTIRWAFPAWSAAVGAQRANSVLVFGVF
ncbi:hypothetical protein [Cupriavidus sp. WS]|uniref:hypothetical protein n=1 Tax=Cupriavidus sp. WS TaxID=1312922 RepID=UPI0009DC0E41|nr:hypothetical protein [Cupriavidus sp. WS]